MSVDGSAAFSKLKVQRECAVEVTAVVVGMKQLLSVCKSKPPALELLECWSVQPEPMRS